MYFFVDDEAIPLVYARNLLRGHGFVYTILEGRAEGYSDFLHVLWSTALLGITRLLRLPRLTPLLAGKAVSVAAALALIVLTARLLRRSAASVAGLAAGLGFLAVAGPLAVWSCSSLETATFAVMVLAFADALLAGPRWRVILLGTLLVLARTDGAVYAFTLVLVTAAALPARRHEVWASAQAIAVGAGVYHAWRVLYFGSLLSAPLAAKVLYRLSGSPHALVKTPDETYLGGFMRLYGVAAAPALAFAVAASWRAPGARAATLALIVLGLYVQLVGDWMFGWRFVVALLPFAAIVIGLGVTRLPRAVGWCAAALVLAWSGSAARAFVHDYTVLERKPVFWVDPYRGEAAWLGRYYELLRSSRGLVHAGDRIAFNQAGLIPYVLDVENIDDLGICSDFVAKLPTTDVYYTGVGRYSPLTNQPVVRTAHAFVLYHDVGFVISATDLLYKANRGTLPEALLGDRFSRVAVDASGDNVIYRRSIPSTDAFRHDPALFEENLVHFSRLREAVVDGRPVAADRLGPDLPFLRELASARTFTGAMEIDLEFATHDEDVHGLFIGEVSSEIPASILLTLRDEGGRETLKQSYSVQPGRNSINARFPPGIRAARLVLKITVAAGQDRIVLGDLRLQGQSAALREYIGKRLVFR
jgi:hypothetical protein